jgi:hypothetical protein
MAVRAKVQWQRSGMGRWITIGGVAIGSMWCYQDLRVHCILNRVSKQ